MSQWNKKDLLEQVIKTQEEQLEILVKAAFEAKEFSTSEESKAENKYDTRGLEASYLASGQASRAQKLQEQIYLLKKMNLKDLSPDEAIGMGALVEILVDDRVTKHLFVLPAGGVEIHAGGKSIQTITVESPIGRELLGQRVGQDFEINQKVYEIVSVW
jgi:transcription elongation GreA/GreB family factor